MLSFKDVSAYQRDGYVLAENVFSPEEVARMIYAIENGGRVSETTKDGQDASGKQAKLAIWHELGDDIWTAASTHPSIVNSVRILLGEDASFFHGKVMLKEAKTGGAWEWHQDYGYWYNQGFIYPNLISAFVALDEATLENGCLRVLKGSHLMGRMDHGIVGTQTGVDLKRLSVVETLLEEVPCVMKPGSVLFFHSNLLHASSANESDKHRRSFITCYNAVSNPQMKTRGAFHRPSCPVGSEGDILNY